jgi:pimeloyl-ACP methyl ester carboxylesterase
MTVRLASVLVAALVLASACVSQRPEDDRVVSLPDRTAPTTTTVGPPIDYTPVYNPGPCPSQLPPYVPDAVGMTCGHLTVPENRFDADDGDVVLSVGVLHSRSPDPRPDPVVYLDGGPGGAGIDKLGLFIDHPILNDRDVILLGQRGTRYSAPTLDCPEHRSLVIPQLGQQADSDESREAEEGALAACFDRLEGQGVPLSSYNSAENAADVVDLRVAMGIPEWNLLGISYGTRLALEVLRADATGVRSVTLDSTYPPAIDSFASFGPNFQRALDTLFASCEATDCATRYPDLRNRFSALLDRLEAEPQSVEARTETGVDVTVLWDADRVVGFVFRALYDAEAIGLLPYLIGEFEAGRFVEASEFLVNVSAESMLAFSDGMYASVGCRERAPFTDLGALESGMVALDPDIARATSGQEYVDDCEVWAVHPADAVQNEPVVSEVPTLVLAGELDPITPPAWGELAAASLSRSTFVLVPGIGHGATPEPCPASIIVAFLAAPETPPATGCVGGLGPPTWR